MLACEGVRVVTVGEQADFDVHALFQQHVYPSDGRFDTGGITVVKYGHVVGETVDHAYLSGSQRRARRSDYILDARLMHGDNIRIAFHQEATVLLHNGLLGKVNAV